MPQYATTPGNIIPPKKGEVRNPKGKPKVTGSLKKNPGKLKSGK